MYQPKQFEETRPEVLHGLMRAHPLSTLVVLTAGGLEANHIPLLVDPSAGPHGTLRGHTARANPFWREALSGTDALAIFAGPQAYISPGYYPSKKEHGKVVPTWNYAVVHARGPLVVKDDAAWLRTHLEEMVSTQEAPMAAPWKVGDAPADFIAGLVQAIVGFEIPLAKLEGKWKMSQNRPAADRAGVIAALGDSPVAGLVPR